MLPRARRTNVVPGGRCQEEEHTVAFLGYLTLDAYAQVEALSQSGAAGADRQDSSGALQWEAHIEVLNTAAAPPQQAAAAVPAQGHRRESADRASVPPGATSVHPGAAEADECSARHVQQSSQVHLTAVGASAQYAEKDNSMGLPETVFAGNDAASGLQQAKGQPPHLAGVQARSQVSPWTDAAGVLNEPYWRRLTQRAMSAVLRSPGMLQPHQVFLDRTAPEEATESFTPLLL